MLRIREVKIPISLDNDEYIKKKISKLLNISKEEIIDYKILKKSIDARDKKNILYIYEFALNLKNENKINLSRNISEYIETKYLFNKEKDLKERPIIVGSGPAGLFCAYMLASVGCKPIILERGEKYLSLIHKASSSISAEKTASLSMTFATAFILPSGTSVVFLSATTKASAILLRLPKGTITLIPVLTFPSISFGRT